ncbi:MAG TPA: serine/threonine-protein kinase [Sandaracinaceae bacterium LLY-WYZ-13_1]|nr:serine/threonine-protein kinase [Sandaracinaceae bacterium LLY-WYZ-13_1]
MSDLGTANTMHGDGVDEPPADPLVGRVLDGRYRIVERLGEGGMGLVYEATHDVLGKRLAIKVLRSDVVGDREAFARFEREAQAASAIGNEHIVDVRDFGRLEDGGSYVVMELIEGVNLLQELRSAPLAWPRACRIGRQICEALGAAHERGIVHRDLKPENVLLTARRGEPDFVKIVDFGIAKVTHGAKQLTAAGRVVGTPEYMAPEQCAGRSVDHRADVYAFGVLLYEMTTGVLPFYDDDLAKLVRMQMREKPVPPSKARPSADLPLSFEAVILRCLAKDPDRRFGSMAEVAEALERALRGSGDRALPPDESLSASVESWSDRPAPGDGSSATRNALAVEARPSAGVGSRARLGLAALGVLAATGLGLGGWLLVEGSAPAEPAGAEPAEVADAPEEASAPTPDPASPPAPATSSDAPTRDEPTAEAGSRTLVESEPSGAEVHREGVLLGVTPLEVERPRRGERATLELRLAHHRSHEVTLSHLTADRFRIVLERRPRRGARSASRPRATSEPSGAARTEGSPPEAEPEPPAAEAAPESPGREGHGPGFMDPWSQ